MSFDSGTRLGPYEILEVLGAGGMGEVYRAHDQRLDRPAAIKLLPAKLAFDRRKMTRFRREAKALAALSHPNIVTVYDVGDADGMPYVVSELLEGRSLGARLADGPRPKWQEVVEVGLGIARGLAAAHDKGIVHRDVKPDNVFLTADGQVKILDFGIARIESLPAAERKTGEESTTASEKLTETADGQVLGTLGYMAPEQLDGSRAEARSDLFSLGCVLYEMLTGRHPFHRGSLVETIMAVMREAPRPIVETGASPPSSLDSLVMRCLAKDPASRPESAREVVRALEGLIGSGAVEVPWLPAEPLPPPAAPSRRSAWLWALTLVLVLAVVAWWWQARRPPPPSVAGGGMAAASPARAWPAASRLPDGVG